MASVGDFVGGIETNVREPVDEHSNAHPQLHSGKVMAQAVVGSSGERVVVASGAANIEDVGGRSPHLPIAVG